jgi:tetratricopeptide (TPR) repeat protein
MSKKNIFIITGVVIIIIAGYFITMTTWFTLWRTPAPDTLTSGQVKAYYERYLQGGINKANAGDYRGAVMAYQQAVKIAPGSVPPKNNIAEACIQLQDYACAERWLLEIIKREYDPNTVVKLSKLYHENLHDDQKAVDILLSAYQLFPKYLDFSYQLGFLYREMGEHDKALEYLRKAQELAPDDQNIRDLINELEG